jgi:hypothetical protein
MSHQAHAVSRLTLILAALAAAPGAIAQTRDVPALAQMADASAVDLGAGRVLRLYTAYLPSGVSPDANAVVSALIVIHGHPHDANRTLGAAVLAVSRAGRASDTVVAAPLFQVASPAARRCRFPGNPEARQDDALWTCDSWMTGERA